MTTSTFYGLRTTVDPITGEILTSTGTAMSFIGPDTLTSFGYTILVPSSVDNPFPQVELTSETPYGLAVDGTQLSEAQVLGIQAYVGEIAWGAGNTSQFMNIALSATEQLILVLGGDVLPVDGTSTVADIQAWQATITSMGAVASGPFAPGVVIPFDVVANATFTPHDILLGTVGADYFHMGAGKDNVDGGLGDDRLWGDSGKDNLAGGDGNDKIRGGTQNDQISGGNNDDDLGGEDGNDTISGGMGIDAISGGNGDDRLAGDAGTDTILGGKGNDLIDGGTENDWIDGGKGDDKILGNTGDDEIVGGKGNDLVLGGDGNDTISANNGNDIVLGGKGNDLISGGNGNDTLIGGKGNDEMSGGAGDDIMTGGKGADTFIFYTASIGNDTITDYDIGADLIRLTDYLTANPGVAYTDAADLVSTYATVVGGTDVLFDFGNGDSITLTGLTTTLGLDATLLL